MSTKSGEDHGVHSVKLENVFRRIHTNSANLFHGRPPLSEIYSDLILARLMPSGAVHTNRRSVMRSFLIVPHTGTTLRVLHRVEIFLRYRCEKPEISLLSKTPKQGERCCDDNQWRKCG